MRLWRVLSAVVLLAVTAGTASADHGYWPESGVTPAVVTGHREATADATDPSSWGPGCRGVDNGGSIDDGGLDVYGALLVEDHALVAIVASRIVNGRKEGWLDGPYGITVFRDARAGEFVWADVDGSGEFGNTHEADAGLMILCPASGLPRTDADAAGTEQPAPVTPGALLTLAAGLAALAFVLVRSRAAGASDRSRR